jgi:phosphatidylserine decarboxylase
LKQYDADDTQTLSILEITSMLDSLGSTLSQETIKTFFHRFGRNDTDELTVDEAIQCLEQEVSRPRSERKVVNNDEPSGIDSGLATPNIMSEVGGGSRLKFEAMDFSGPPRPPQPFEMDSDTGSTQKPSMPASYLTEPSQTLILPEKTPDCSPKVVPGGLPHPDRENSASSSDADDSSGNGSSEDSVERVINVKTCPLCHRPRLNAKVELDIITHIALCASQDWNSVDRIVVGNFVTPSQAHRKWFMKVISKVSNGSYQLGAVRISWNPA